MTTSPALPVLEIKDLCIDLHPDHAPPVRAVRPLNFTMHAGDTLGLIGESGCGKSLTALAIMGLLPRRARAHGQVLLKGEDLLQMTQAQYGRVRGRHISMVFQNAMSSLNPLHTVGAQVAEPLRWHLHMGAEEALERAAVLLERVGIDQARQRLKAYPHEFSGGQRQRIAIAMALACKPDVLIADEPTTALDVTRQREVLILLQELARENHMALLLISHDLSVIAQSVRRLMVMYAGCVMEYGASTTLLQHPAHPYTQGLLHARAPLHGPRQRLQAIPGHVPPLSALPSGCVFSNRCPQALAKCHEQVPNLEMTRGHESPHQVSCWLNHPEGTRA